jgi:hypothetical protein
MSFARLLLVYVFVLLGTLTAAGIYTYFRQRRFQHPHTSDRIFRCARCGFVYTDDPDVDRSRCSQCGQMNEPIQF